jgi:hypothetical protein
MDWSLVARIAIGWCIAAVACTLALARWFRWLRDG